MKFLCICQHGHSRSVALCRELHSRHHEAVPVGWATSPSAVGLLGDWADHIAVLCNHFVVHRPEWQHLQPKIVRFPIGPDIWSNPYHPDLIAKLKPMVDAEGW